MNICIRYVHKLLQKNNFVVSVTSPDIFNPIERGVFNIPAAVSCRQDRSCVTSLILFPSVSIPDPCTYLVSSVLALILPAQ